jgi:hypothetical protein
LSRFGGPGSAGVEGGGFCGCCSACGRRRGVSFGSWLERSGGFFGIAESGRGVVEGILRVYLAVGVFCRRMVTSMEERHFRREGFHMPRGLG